MDVCLVGHLTNQPDEGVRNITTHLAHALRASHKVKLLPMRPITTWQRIRASRPDIIHFVLTPTGAGLMAAKALTTAHPQARTIISAPHPSGDVFKRWLTPFKPDLILAQALDSEQKFRARGYRTEFLPNGIDLEQFKPVDETTKHHLRQQHNLDGKFVILHVGPLKAGRNVQLLGQIQGNNGQVLIVGRPSDPGERTIAKKLAEQGCLVWCKYFERIQDIYALADCYVFPTFKRDHCIKMPLSVLEAIACNLPVVSTPFGALPRVVDAGDGIVYAQTPEAFKQAIAVFETAKEAWHTRQKVLNFSWANLARKLESIYERLLST